MINDDISAEKAEFEKELNSTGGSQNPTLKNFRYGGQRTFSIPKKLNDQDSKRLNKLKKLQESNQNNDLKTIAVPMGQKANKVVFKQ